MAEASDVRISSIADRIESSHAYNLNTWKKNELNHVVQMRRCLVQVTFSIELNFIDILYYLTVSISSVSYCGIAF